MPGNLNLNKLQPKKNHSEIQNGFFYFKSTY